MNIKQLGIYSLRLCVSLAFVGVILLPVQAAVFVPVPTMKPLKSLELSAPTDMVHLDVRARSGVPVPTMKPSFGQESSFADKRKTFQPSEYMKLTGLLSTIKSLEPAAGNLIERGRSSIAAD